MQGSVDGEQRRAQEAQEAISMAERRVAVLSGEVDEIRSTLDSAEKGRKIAEGELFQANDRVNELSAQVNSLQASKRKLEGDIRALNNDFDEINTELRSADERSKKATIEAARMAEELHSEQEHSQQITRYRKGLESQIKELQSRLEEAEASALKGGKKVIAQMESRVRIIA